MSYLRAIRGDTERYAITLADAEGDPLDLDTLSEIWFSVRDDGVEIINKTLTDGGITVTDADAGTAEITLDPADTEDLATRALSLAFDVQVLDTASGDISTPIRGRIRISPDVTTATS